MNGDTDTILWVRVLVFIMYKYCVGMCVCVCVCVLVCGIRVGIRVCVLVGFVHNILCVMRTGGHLTM